MKKKTADLIDLVDASEGDSGEGLQGEHEDGGGHTPLPAALVVRS